MNGPTRITTWQPSAPLRIPHLGPPRLAQVNWRFLGFPTCRVTRRRTHCPRSYPKQALSHTLPPPAPHPRSPSWGWPLEGTVGTLPLKPLRMSPDPPLRWSPTACGITGPLCYCLQNSLFFLNAVWGTIQLGLQPDFLCVCVCVWLESRRLWKLGRSNDINCSQPKDLVSSLFKILKLNFELYRSSLELLWVKLKYNKSG